MVKIIKANLLPPRTWLPTFSVGVNKAINDGLESGHSHLMWGKTGSGKTTCALYLIKEAQKRGLHCVYVDAEKSWSEHWFEKIGVDLNKLDVLVDNSVENIVQEVAPLLDSGKADVVVVDSLTHIRLSSAYKDYGGNNPMGLKSRSMNLLSDNLLHFLGMNQWIILIGHTVTKEKGNSIFGQDPDISNGVAHDAHNIIKFHKSASKDKVREDGSFPVFWELQKSRQGPFPIGGEFYFNPYTACVNTTRELVSCAIGREIINKAASWLSYKEHKAQGEEKFAQLLDKDSKLYSEILDRIK